MITTTREELAAIVREAVREALASRATVPAVVRDPKPVEVTETDRAAARSLARRAGLVVRGARR